MGNLKKGTLAWHLQLAKNRAREQAKRDAALCASGRGKRLLAADRAAQTKASSQELARSRAKSNRHMRDSRQWKAAAERATAELQVVRKRLVKKTDALEVLQADLRKRLVKKTDALEALQADLEETRQALNDTHAEKRKAEKERQTCALGGIGCWRRSPSRSGLGCDG